MPTRPMLLKVSSVEPGTTFRHEGANVTLTRIARSDDGYHWRLWVQDRDRYIVLPPGAVLTLAQ